MGTAKASGERAVQPATAPASRHAAIVDTTIHQLKRADEAGVGTTAFFKRSESPAIADDDKAGLELDSTCVGVAYASSARECESGCVAGTIDVDPVETDSRIFARSASIRAAD